jgi:tetratricopeptide (TPR) repeat protein
MMKTRWLWGMLLLVLYACSAAAPARASQMSFVKDYVYQASEVDSKVSSRAIALEQVKRLLLEQVGTFVQSETTVKEFMLSKDEVVTLTAGIVSVEIMNEEWDGKQYALTARVAVDPQQVAEAVDHLRGNTVDRAELETSRKQNEESLKEIERLRADMDSLRREAQRSEEQAASLRKELKESADQTALLQQQARKDAERTAVLARLEHEYTQSTESLARNNLFEAAMALRDADDLAGALEKFDRLLTLDPKDKRAYLGRASTYFRMDKTSLAFKDIDQALEIDPKFAKAYMLRGKIQRKMGNYGEAIRQQTKALKLNPDFAEAYFERGLSRLKTGEKREGIDEIKRAANTGLRKAQDFLMSKGIIY